MGRGRKPKSSKNEEITQKQESLNAGVKSPEADSAIKNSPLVNLNENTGSTMPTQDKLEAKEANHPKVYSKKIAKKAPLFGVRRSGRFQKAVMAAENQCIEHIIEEITVSESEKEDDPPNGEFTERAMDGKEIHEKIDYIVELLQAQKKAMDVLNSWRNGVSLLGESSEEVKYKSLYLDSQKKIEALMEENKQLSGKLEHANGKIEIYEKGDHVSYDMLEKVKDVLFGTTGTRAIEPVVNGSIIAAEGALECKSPRRKRAI